ncbi:MAG: riboflavin synthase [Azospirillum brasilense]|nr:MAG: riboflavin synthase [Azospirillum brasilense]
MFTGLITDRGTIERITHQGDVVMQIAPRSGTAFPLAMGASIACNGICLTVTEILPDHAFTVTLSAETMRVTTAGLWREGDSINLEPSLRVGDRLGGHFVSGHVDGLAVALSATPVHESTEWMFEVPESLAPFIATKGSVTLDGVSLTVNSVLRNTFTVMIIPHTAQETGFGTLKLLEKLNIEVDMLARYVARMREVNA